VDPGWVGQRVVTHTVSGHGGNAEQAVAAIEALIAVPEGVSLQEAAALLDDGSTALGLVKVARIRAGEWVLVEAAAGGVGSLLVQLVRAAGARVVGAARGQRKLDLARELGADAVVDALDEIVEETGKTMPQIAPNWLLRRPTVSSVIIGARNEAQLRQNLGAIGWALTPEQLAKLDAASATTAPYPYFPYQRQEGFARVNPPIGGITSPAAA
jgi:D-arabinose 1-dehydrogenase-like Zn-dependent alcohol dehydrogenase